MFASGLFRLGDGELRGVHRMRGAAGEVARQVAFRVLVGQPGEPAVEPLARGVASMAPARCQVPCRRGCNGGRGIPATLALVEKGRL
jgi:hypothetical protein